MIMNKVIRKQVYDALKASKRWLSKGDDDYEFCGTDYICIALAIVGDDNPDHYIGAEKAKKIIAKRLDGCYALDTWLNLKGVSFKDLNDYNMMQAHRHAWLDMLIKEFSK